MSFVADFSQIELQLAAIIARASDPVPFFDYVGLQEVHKTKERILDTKEDPDGDYWVPWKPYTRQKRKAQGNAELGILHDTGELLNSIRFTVDGTFEVDIGTDVWYAQQHQEGAGRIPKREFLGFTPESLGLYAQAYVNYLEGIRI